MTARNQAFTVCLELLDQRGYNILEEDRENLRIIADKPDGESMCVLFNSTPKFDTKSMKETISLMNELGLRHSLVIYTDGVTPATRNTLTQIEEMYIELFNEEDLQYNITKHRLQPVFCRLPSTEAEAFKTEYGAKFGTLRHDKSISRFYDYSKGDVIRITRQDGYINYRFVR